MLSDTLISIDHGIEEIDTSNIDNRKSQFCELPSLNISSPITNMPHLTNADIDLNMPADQNFNYYTINEFNTSNIISECSSNSKQLAALNCNIRSLAANYDNLLHLLSTLNFSFPIIGLTETKFKLDRDQIINTEIPAYDFISQPSMSNAGGVAFYLKNNIHYKIRTKLSVTKTDFEALWIEIQSNNKKT